VVVAPATWTQLSSMDVSLRHTAHPGVNEMYSAARVRAPADVVQECQHITPHLAAGLITSTGRACCTHAAEAWPRASWL
jgi:hypothetical protein